MGYNKCKLSRYIQEYPPEWAPCISDDQSLSYQIGVDNRSMWYMVNCCLLPPINVAKEGTKNNPFYFMHRIPKSSGGVRTVYEVSSSKPVRDSAKIILQGLTSLLFKDFPWEEHVDAYVPEKSIKHSAEKHAGAKTAVFMDLQDFFPSVTRGMIRNFLNTEMKMNWRVACLISSLCTLQRRLPQGSPIASHMANAVAMTTFDRKIQGALSSNSHLSVGWVYSRYSDDIIVSNKTDIDDQEVALIQQIILDSVGASGFRINGTKTRVAGVRGSRLRSVQWLGYTINEKVNISQEDYRALRLVLYYCSTTGFARQAELAGEDTDKFISMIRGRLNFAKTALSQPRIEKLEEYFLQGLAVEAINRTAKTLVNKV